MRAASASTAPPCGTGPRPQATLGRRAAVRGRRKTGWCRHVAIRSRADLEAYLEADLAASDRSRWTWRHQISPASRERIMRWQRSQRRLEFWTSQPPSLILRLRLAVLWRLHLRRALNLGFTIPLHTFGPGLSIQHYGTITVNEHARIGASCRIHPLHHDRRDSRRCAGHRRPGIYRRRSKDQWKDPARRQRDCRAECCGHEELSRQQHCPGRCSGAGPARSGALRASALIWLSATSTHFAKS